MRTSGARNTASEAMAACYRATRRHRGFPTGAQDDLPEETESEHSDGEPTTATERRASLLKDEDREQADDQQPICAGSGDPDKAVWLCNLCKRGAM